MIQSKKCKNEWVETNEMMIQFDVNARMSDVSIISKAAYLESKQNITNGFCHNRFKPNLVVSMNSDEEEKMKVDVELDIDGVKLFVLVKKHRCHEQCPLYGVTRQPCRWTSHIYYAGIIKGGMVKKGCPVVI